MNKEEKLKEQKKKAQKKYWETHREYYRKQSLNEAKRVRKERNLYKEIIKEVREYLDDVPNNNADGWQCGRESLAEELLQILNKGENND